LTRALILVWVLAATAQTPQWRVLPIRSQQEYSQGLPGGEGEQYLHGMTRCRYHPQYIYLGHDVGGSWRSADSGKTWQKALDKGLRVLTCLGIAVDPADPLRVLIMADNSFNWLAAGEEGLYRSIDGGENWTRVLAVATNFDPALHRMYHATIAWDPSTADSVTPASRWYAATHNGGLYRSDDGGVTWSSRPVGDLTGYATVHVVCPHPLNGRTVYVGTNQGLLVSDSLGAGLHPLGNLPAGEVTSVFVDPRDPARVLVALKGVGLYRSADSGATFTQMRAHNTAHLFVNPTHPLCMFLIGLSSGSLTTVNGGANWVPLPFATTFPGLGRESGWRREWDGMLCAVTPSPADSLEAVAHSRATMFRTTDAGRHIRESATGFTGNAWGWYNSAVAFDRNDPARIAFFCYDVGMRITLNNGNWFEENTNAQAWNWYQAGQIGWLGTYAGSFAPVPGSQTIVEAIGDYWNTRIATSRNNGALWSLAGDSGDAGLNLFVSYHPADGGVVYAGGSVSIDSGATFAPVNFGGAYDRPEIVGMVDAYPDVVYAMDYGRNVVLRSSDRGGHWREYTRPGWQMRKLDPMPTFAAHPTDTSLIYSIDSRGDLAVFDGAAWRSLHVLDLAGGPSWNYVRSVTLDPRHPQIIYAGMLAPGGACVLRSSDAGSTWEDVSYNLPRLGCGGMGVNPHTGELYKGSGAGTWILPPPYASVSRPAAGALAGPGGKRVRIRLAVIGGGAFAGGGTLVYDMQGRMMSQNTLRNGGLRAVCVADRQKR
jgi:hypothetical protein